MAKAKKPASGARTLKATSDDVTKDKPKAADTGKNETPEVSSASKAASAKTTKTAGAAAKTTKDASAASDTKAPAAKTATDSKSDPKPATAGLEEKPKSTLAETKSDKPDPAPKSDKPATAASKPAETTTASASASRAPVASPPPAQPQQQRSIFLPLVLGGIIAGVLGFLASEMNVFNTRANTAELRQQLAAQQDEIDALGNIAPAESVDLSGIEETISGVSASLETFETTLAEVEDRLTILENRPVITTSDDGAAQAYAEELATLKTSVEEQKSEIARLLENALSVEEATANAARQAEIQAALTKINAALATGGGFASAVEDLNAAGVTDVPDPLASSANEGVSTLLQLQTDFPDTARAALSSARAAGTDAGEGGMTGFLRRQLGARSVAPREGTDPDAVLSRAEAAVRNGQVAQALSEIDTLPPEAQDAMADWLAQARSRVDAEAAVQDLSQRLTAN